MTIQALAKLALATLALCATWSPLAQGAAQTVPEPAPADLKFGEMFKRPVGPKGLEPSAKLLALDGQRVRLVGYMARQAAEFDVPGLMILVPLPVALGDEDESFADDLPASAAYIHLADAPTASTPLVPYRPGLLALTGTLELGAQAEPDGRVSFVRLQRAVSSSSIPTEKAP